MGHIYQYCYFVRHSSHEVDGKFEGAVGRLRLMKSLYRSDQSWLNVAQLRDRLKYDDKIVVDSRMACLVQPAVGSKVTFPLFFLLSDADWCNQTISTLIYHEGMSFHRQRQRVQHQLV
jgi:hypothetical protein